MSRERSRLDVLIDEYFERFGEMYPLVITDMRSEQEVEKDIERCIRTGKKKKAPKLKQGLFY